MSVFTQCFTQIKAASRKPKQRAHSGPPAATQSSNASKAASSAHPKLGRQHLRNWLCCGANDPSWNILENLHADDAIAFYEGKAVPRTHNFNYTNKLRIVRRMPNAQPGMNEHIEKYLRAHLSPDDMNRLTTALNNTPERGGVIKFKLRFNQSTRIWSIDNLQPMQRDGTPFAVRT